MRIGRRIEARLEHGVAYVVFSAARSGFFGFGLSLGVITACLGVYWIWWCTPPHLLLGGLALVATLIIALALFSWSVRETVVTVRKQLIFSTLVQRAAALRKPVAYSHGVRVCFGNQEYHVSGVVEETVTDTPREVTSTVNTGDSVITIIVRFIQRVIFRQVDVVHEVDVAGWQVLAPTDKGAYVLFDGLYREEAIALARIVSAVTDPADAVLIPGQCLDPATIS